MPAKYKRDNRDRSELELPPGAEGQTLSWWVFNAPNTGRHSGSKLRYRIDLNHPDASYLVKSNGSPYLKFNGYRISTDDKVLARYLRDMIKKGGATGLHEDMTMLPLRCGFDVAGQACDWRRPFSREQDRAALYQHYLEAHNDSLDAEAEARHPIPLEAELVA